MEVAWLAEARARMIEAKGETRTLTSSLLGGGAGLFKHRLANMREAPVCAGLVLDIERRRPIEEARWCWMRRHRHRSIGAKNES